MHPDPVSAKAELRQQFLDSRQQLGDRTRRQAQAIEALRANSIWRAAGTIASYRAFGAEFDLASFDHTVFARGKTVVLPRVSGPGVMTLHAWRPGDALRRSQQGIEEPLPTSTEVPATSVDLFLIPLVAWDCRGRRLGYGGGYYDRLLEGTSGFRLGAAFACQQADALPGEDHDQRLDAVLTELGLTTLPKR